MYQGSGGKSGNGVYLLISLALGQSRGPLAAPLSIDLGLKLVKYNHHQEVTVEFILLVSTYPDEVKVKVSWGGGLLRITLVPLYG